LEQETTHPTLVSLRLLIEEYAEVVAALTRHERELSKRWDGWWSSERLG